MEKCTSRGRWAEPQAFPERLEPEAGRVATSGFRDGKPYAALVPASLLLQGTAHVDIRALRGSGKGLWGRSVRRTLRELREEWR